METDRSSRKGSSKMDFLLDLNETPAPSPRETADEVEVGTGISVCPVCRKGIPVGRVPGKAAEQRQESKCFRCLLKNDSDGGSDVGGRGGACGNEVEVGRFDINASPPREPEEGDCVEVIAVRDGNGGGKVQASILSSSSLHASIRQMNPAPDEIGLYPQKMMSVATDSSNSGFRDMLGQRKLHHEDLHPVRKGSTVDSRVQDDHSTPLGIPLDSPNMLYLQTLREYIAERSGVLEEGWHVEFEFCNKSHKTSAVYIAPDGSRLKSMEDVALYIGLPSRYQLMETVKGSSTGFGVIHGGLKIDPTKKESSASLSFQSSRQRQRMLKASKNQGFLSGRGIISQSENVYNRGFEELGFSDNGNHRDVIYDGFPIQFKDFFLISAGNIDPRPSYHNTNQIWPIGYRSTWHDRVTRSLFVCDIADGGDSGPIFKVQRYPCTKQSIPVGSTVLTKVKPCSGKGDDNVEKDDLVAFQVVDDDSISTITLLNEDSPPSLDNCLSKLKKEDGSHNLLEDNSSNSDLECLPHRSGILPADAVELSDVVGEFQVEGRSTSSVWETVTQAFLYAYHVAYKQKGAIKFFCGHEEHETNDQNLDCNDSLLRYGSFDGRISIPSLVHSENDFKIACEMLLSWLNQDRFGLDADFVQEIIEQSHGVSACSDYRSLNSRKPNSLLTVSSGFLTAECKTNNAARTMERSQLKPGGSESVLRRKPCPPGTPLNSKLPSYLLGDALQVWEYAWRYSDILGLGLDFSFQELELELASPWIDSYHQKSRHDAGNPSHIGVKIAHAGAMGGLGRSGGLLSAKIIGALLKVLVCELMSKAAAYVCPNFDTGESKGRRGKKRDVDPLSALKKTKLDMLPINELTWHEIAHRYILAVLSMDGNPDSTEIASRESGKVFHCLQGDGGILCGSLTGIAALEGDAMVLADSMKEIYGSLKGKNEIVSLSERDSDVSGAQTVEVNDSSVPEWAQVLEPVRKLPTNVGARIRRCIYEALERNPPEWAKLKLEWSISKDVYKGNASGPTKRAVIEVLSQVGSDNPQPKAEKQEKVKIKISITDLISKQCRIVLRQAVYLDEDRVFCNLLARRMLSINDNDEDGLLGYPAMVSRPLDFRTIDLRLAAGAYGGSPEAFVDDVREVWRHIRTAYGDRSDLVALAEDLSEKFEDLYEKEVLTLVNKVSGVSNVGDPNAEAVKERDDLLVCVCNRSLPRAPWEEGICKVCGMDKDDDNVLLCDKCDSEYHRYCLNPPLLRIPEGNWYCPSCVGPCGPGYSSAVNQSRKKKYQGEFTRKFLEELARLATLMEVKEYWEFTIEERIFFMKFLFDEALNSATIREHMDQCSSRVADLQQRLRSCTSELKLMKVKEEILGLSTEKPNSGMHNGRGDLISDASSSLPAIGSSSKGKPSETGSHISCFSGFTQQEHPAEDHSQHGNLIVLAQPSRGPNLQHEALVTIQQLNIDQKQTNVQRESQGGSVISSSQVMPGHNLSAGASDRATSHVPPAPLSIMQEPHRQHSPNQVDMLPSKDYYSKEGAAKNDIVNLQNSIAAMELELLKVSLRKDFLGRDSDGRIYWVFHSAGARPWLVSSGDLASKNRPSDEFMGVPGSEKWMFYESDAEIDKLIGWLRDDHAREKELSESILQVQSNKLKDSQYAESHMLSKGVLDDGKRMTSDALATKAMTSLEMRFGPCLGTEATDACQRLTGGVNQDGRMYRCECLELLWPSKYHCFSCHRGFASDEELKQHANENCKAAASSSKRSQATSEDASKRKRPRIAVSQEKHSSGRGFLQSSTRENRNDVSSFAELNKSDCPFNFEEIMTRFVVQGSVKDDVNEIGLIGSGGIPTFVPISTPYLCDVALTLSSVGINEGNSSEVPNYLRSHWKMGARVGMQENKEPNGLSRYAESGLAGRTTAERLRSALVSESDQVSSFKEKGGLIGLSKGSIIRESSSRPLVGKASEVLRLLKINLLDMDDALLQDALRVSRTNHDKRRAWRDFIKSARSIYEMVQAIIVFEDTIKSEYLRNYWWYWSSPSTAAKITTLSALALRIYTLDSAIFYDKPLVNSATDTIDPNSGVEEDTPPGKNVANLASPSQHNTPEPDPTDNTRTTRSRASKRRKDQSG